MPYNGPGKNPYWMTVTSAVNATNGVQTENIPVVVDSTTTYKFTVTVDFAAGSHSGHAQITFYDNTNTSTGTSNNIGTGTITPGTPITVSTTALVAPANSAYCIGRLVVDSTSTDEMKVYQAAVSTAANTAQPAIVNLNYAFVYGTAHWTTTIGSVVIGWEFDPLTAADGDFDSLVIDGLIELMGGTPGVQCGIPECTDPATGRSAIFRISAPGGATAAGSGTTGPYDLGAAQPTTDVVESLLLDGEFPYGERSSNRTMTIPVMIFAPTLATLAAARETLLSVIDQQTWKLFWRAASSGNTAEYDCFRALPTVVTYGFNNNREGGAGGNPSSWALSIVTIQFPAMPYVRSGQDGAQVVNFTNGTLDAGAVTPSLTIDTFTSVNSASDGGGSWAANTAYVFGSSQSVRYSAPVPMHMPWAPATYTATGLSLNLTGLPIIGAWFGLSYDTQWPLQKTFTSNLTLQWTLTDGNGHSLSFSGIQRKCPWGADPNRPAWTRIGATIPQGMKKNVFDYSNVTGYKVKILNWSGSGTSGLVRMHAWMSQVVAMAKSVQWINTPHASVYSVFGLNGMARSPLSAEIQLQSVNPVTVEISRTGLWTVPRGVTSVFAEAWGAGGGGGSLNAISGGLYAGGGGGGEYVAEPVVTTIPGTQIPVQIGAGGSGGNVISRSALFLKPGKNTWTCPGGVTVITCYMWGGGAAGAAGGGGGGAGAFTLGTANVTPGTTYTYDVGAGGAANWGLLSKDQATRHGGDTVVRADSGALHAHGGNSPVTGSSVGGTGGSKVTSAESGTTITLAQAGGNGGKSPGGAGGGGAGAPSIAGQRNNGSDSSKGSNNYGSGGPGAVGTVVPAGEGLPSTYTGAGGKGADVGGKPSSGVSPGGGGGGGYTRSVNNNGGNGANGAIVLFWNENLGNPETGGSTAFGATGLTSKILTAHGGSSPSINNASGNSGGSGSSNTVHFNGGKGGVSGNNQNYNFRVSDNATNVFTQLNRGTGTGTAFTTGVSSAALGTGVAIASVVSTNGVDQNNPAAVVDSVGNVYDYVGVVQLPSAGKVLQYFAARIGTSITTSTTLTVTDSSSDTFFVEWFGSVYYADIDTANLTTATGTGTAANLNNVNPDAPTHKGMFMTWINNSTVAVSSAPSTPATNLTGSTGTSQWTSGTFQTAHYNEEMPGSGTTSVSTVTWASSTAWAALCLPLIPQDTASPIALKVGFANTTGLTSVISLANAFAIPAGNGYLMWVTQFAGTAGTISFTDASTNVWTTADTVTIGSSTLKIFTAKVTNAYTLASSITMNDTTNQAHVSTLYYVSGATGLDGTATNSGTGTTASLTTPAGTKANNLKVAVVANANSVNPTTDPTGLWVNLGANFNGVLHNTPYSERVAGINTDVISAVFTGSQTWGIAGINFTTSIVSGSGGSSGGPGGSGNDGADNGGSSWEGGGKGANGLTGSGNGVNGTVPGGGGSGASTTSSTAQVEGGSGGSGLVRLTYQPPLRTFNDLILHRPGPGARTTLNPVVTIPPNDPPDGREYSVLPLTPGRNAEFQGTYTVYAVNNAWNSATLGSSRRISVTVNQYNYPGGPAVSCQATRVVTPATDIINGYVSMGELTLPIKDYDSSNDNVTYTVSVHDTDTGDSFQDILLLDTAGQLVFVNIAPGTAGDSVYSSYYSDEPTFERALGQLLGTSHGRPQAVSVLDMSMLTGGPLYLTSGENILLAYSTSGAPNLGLSYDPRWFSDRSK